MQPKEGVVSMEEYVHCVTSLISANRFAALSDAPKQKYGLQHSLGLSLSLTKMKKARESRMTRTRRAK